jgi:DNA polymerase-3 subunit alpha
MMRGVSPLSVQLYTHSDYSLLESVCTVESLVRQSAKLGLKSLALTDLGTTAGHGEFEHHCRQAGIKPIFGVELDVADLGHVVLLALTDTGYRNILHLTSQVGPLLRERLAECKSGIALLTGANLTEGLYNWLEAEFGANHYIRYELGQSESPWENYPHHKLVLTQDVRYLEPRSLVTLDVLGKIKGKEIALPPKPLLSWKDLCAAFQGPETVVTTTLTLADRCNVQLPREQMLPPHPDGESLNDLVWQGAQERFGLIRDEVRQRLEHELSTIRALGYEDYFLIVADIVRFAKSAGIAVGPGRGSAASSLVAYVLGITEVDSLSWGLLFERFLNVERNKRPDIDLDFCYERRGEVLSYVVRRFGREHVAQIGTYGTFGPKAASQEVRRVLGEENQAIAREIQGLKRHRSTHAAGVIITARPIQEISAVYLDREVPVTHLDMYALEELGALKIDLLGLRTLTLLHKIEEQVKRADSTFSLEDIPAHDGETLAQLSRGKSLGIFQLESDLFQDLIRKLKPQSFRDLVALLALGRPGPLAMFPEYVSRRDSQAKVKYPHPALEEILGETYGLILYQEQVMLIANRIGGLSLGEADLLRSALSKQDPRAAEKWRTRFTAGAQEAGLSRDAADRLFSMIAKFSGYAFNKAHSVSYARLTWQAAYMKTHYPGEFFLTLINEGSTGKEREMYLMDALGFGLQVLPPSVNHSDLAATLEGDTLRLGLLTNRLLPPQSAAEIVKGKGQWSSLKQLKRATRLDNDFLVKLVLCGALDDLGGRNQHLGELGFDSRRELDLLRAEKELLGVYASNHPCSPFLPLVRNLDGGSGVAAGEILRIKATRSSCMGVLDTPQGLVAFEGAKENFAHVNLTVGSRIAIFGDEEVSWSLPLGPTLLITPNPDNLDTIKSVLEKQNGERPTILLFGEAYHLLPKMYWVRDPEEIKRRLQEEQVVYTWLDPWKENV